jgi:uncharacterized protein (DUF1800 family)
MFFSLGLAACLALLAREGLAAAPLKANPRDPGIPSLPEVTTEAARPTLLPGMLPQAAPANDGFNPLRVARVESVASAVTINSITPSPSLPRVWGTPITWTVSASGGTPPLQYRFYREDGGVWNMVQDYSTGNTYTWTPTINDVGQHDLAVWVKSAGSPNPYDAVGDFGFFNIVYAVNISSLSANPGLPRPVGTTITFTASASGSPGPILYRFWRMDHGTWTMVQDYSTTNIYVWPTAAADIGTHDIAVWCKNQGSAMKFEAIRDTGAFSIIGTVHITSVTAPGTFPKPAGQPITWTTAATGAPGPLEYRYYRSDGGVWSLAQDYSPSATYTWIPPANAVGTHDLAVWVRNVGSTAQFEGVREAGFFTIGAAQPLSVGALLSYPPMPRPQGSLIAFSPQTSGGMAPLQYQFWRLNVQTSTWTMVQDWSTNPEFFWATAAPDVGDHQVAVHIKNAGSTAQFDAIVGTATFTITPPTTDIVRFLEQATWGPTTSEIERVRQMGYQAWIVDQITTPPTGYPPFTPVKDNPPSNCTGNCQRDNYSMYPLQRQFFLNALYGQDQLRQRVAWALHSMIVVSGLDENLPSWYQPYLAAIYNNAFGNYRQLLQDVTLTPAMGDYLNLNTSTANLPNENYAREIMQLFSLGTDLLNIDGTPQTLADGTIIPTYDQFAVTEMARALTGWHFAPVIGPGITNYRDPMIANTANHDLGSKSLLNGFNISPGQTPDQDLSDALDNIFNHPNVGPYVAKHLIHSLVTSNPSPAYVQRIATVFNDNGLGVRGNMQSVVMAILLDPEARQITPADPNYGHLSNPVVMTLKLLRAMNAGSANGQTLSDGYLAPTVSAMGQDVFRPATVFSYYPADYVVPGLTILGPEFGVFQSTTSLKRANFINQMTFSNIPATVATGNAPNGTALDLSSLVGLGLHPRAMVLELSHMLMHDSMSLQMQNEIITAINAVPASNPRLRAQAALYLAASSSQFQVER